MSFQSGLSGLNAASKSIEVIGNNVANANTVGFKGSRALFSDVYASSLSGGGNSGVGIGTKLSGVQQEFTQGNIATTNNSLDLAINGRGFFRYSNNGDISFSRNGQLHVDANGYIVNADGYQLTGYGLDASQNVVASAPIPLRVSTTDLQPRATTEVECTLNLDARSSAIGMPFNPNDAASYTSATSTAIYDSLGNTHAVTMFFAKTATPGQWNLRAQVDGGPLADVDLGAGPGNPVTIAFSNSGTLTTAMPITPVSITLANGAISPLVTALDLSGSTQFGADFSVTTLAQNGYTSGRLSGFDVAENGRLLGRYSNGTASPLGQLVLANFANMNGLRAVGNNQWEETSESGQPVLGSPMTGSLGSIKSAAIENSNVDLTQELVSMITAQRVYQANAQTIKTQDQTLQTIVNLR